MKQVIKQVQPIDEDELATDLKFLYHNRSDTVDQFIEEATAVMRYHLNQAVANYQYSLHEDLKRQISNEILQIIVRSEKPSIVQSSQQKQAPSEEADSGWAS